MKILAIDTATDETSAAVTDGVKVLSNIIWSQASLHAKWGGVVPSLAQRKHRERIGWVIEKALKQAFPKQFISSPLSLIDKNIDAIAVTVGPCLAIAGEVGIAKAKELAKKYKKPLIPVNHVEGHLLSALAERSSKLKTQNSKLQLKTKNSLKFPALGIVVSGGTTPVVYAERLGNYKILANTMDDALGEALDKGARLLGLGYPGGVILEKLAKEGKINSYPLPIPMLGREDLNKFSYSGLKTALVRLVDKITNEKGSLGKTTIENLAASYQNTAFTHLTRVTSSIINHLPFTIHHLFVGGGVGANVELRKQLRKMAKEYNLAIHLPYSKRLYTDNAAMIGVAAYFSYQQKKYLTTNFQKIDRIPRLKIDQ